MATLAREGARLSEVPFCSGILHNALFSALGKEPQGIWGMNPQTSSLLQALYPAQTLAFPFVKQEG